MRWKYKKIKYKPLIPQVFSPTAICWYLKRFHWLNSLQTKIFCKVTSSRKCLANFPGGTYSWDYSPNAPQISDLYSYFVSTPPLFWSSLKKKYIIYRKISKGPLKKCMFYRKRQVKKPHIYLRSAKNPTQYRAILHFFINRLWLKIKTYKYNWRYWLFV